MAQDAVTQALAQQGVLCRHVGVSAQKRPITRGDVPVDQGGVPMTAGGRSLEGIFVDVTCTVRVNDLFVVWVPPGEVTLHGSFTSVIDLYRSGN
ncbi:hypothetical protein GCM10009665_73880 [Kitasatospora nipponensis]|uniref:Uncharacterized protein n=1 Tax=Kitasatospora nipponensis TaxID=258049 RepID=A0ABN1T745_9ACTN